MLMLMGKSTSINLRISPDFRRELEALATYRGLTLSGVAHSLLVRAVRQEKEREPEAFEAIIPKTTTKNEVQRMLRHDPEVLGPLKTSSSKAKKKDDVRIMYQKEADIIDIGDAVKPLRRKKAS